MERVTKLVPGLIFTALLAWLAVEVQQVGAVKTLHLSSLIIAILMGMVIRNSIKLPAPLDPGIKFSLKKILRLGIILLGFRLSFAEVSQIGGKGLILVSLVTTATILFSVWLGKRLGLEKSLALLIGAGSSICGASAVAAVAPVIDAEEKDTTFAIATITIFGTIAMFLYPALYRLFHLPNLLYAVWTGSSVHEVAQVVAAGFAAGEQAGQFATLVKLTRVLMVIPAVIIIGFTQVKGKKGSSIKKVTIPWFVFGFLAVVILNSLFKFPPSISAGLNSFDSFLLTMAMAGMGLETSFAKMKQAGVKPFYAGLITSLFIAILSFTASEFLFG